jgi:aspartate dehydrogenase
MSKIKGIIGCGAIGSYLAKALCREFAEEANLAFLCDANSQNALRLRNTLDRDIQILDWEKLIQSSDLVIEAASAAVSASIAKSALSQGQHVLVMSMGGLLGTDWTRISKGENFLI